MVGDPSDALEKLLDELMNLGGQEECEWQPDRIREIPAEVAAVKAQIRALAEADKKRLDYLDRTEGYFAVPLPPTICLIPETTCCLEYKFDGTARPQGDDSARKVIDRAMKDYQP